MRIERPTTAIRSFTTFQSIFCCQEQYGQDRAVLISSQASAELRPGIIKGHEHLAAAAITRAGRKIDVLEDPATGEPTMAHLTDTKGDTVHLDIVDRWGNLVSSTPSGGWLQSNPIVPGLGFALNSRAQMFWLDEGSGLLAETKGAAKNNVDPDHCLSPGWDQACLWHTRWRPAGSMATRLVLAHGASWI